jgi:hypothetical protein
MITFVVSGVLGVDKVVEGSVNDDAETDSALSPKNASATGERSLVVGGSVYSYVLV